MSNGILVPKVSRASIEVLTFTFLFWIRRRLGSILGYIRSSFGSIPRLQLVVALDTFEGTLAPFVTADLDPFALTC